jgi:UDP-N-acetylglucosamine 4-epimerase
MKYLITGGAGFIGTNLCHYINKNYKNYSVVVVDNNIENCNKLKSLFPNIEIINKDFTDKSILDKVECGEYDGVFHLAAVPRVAFSVDYPLISHEENLTKTLILAKACCNDKKIPFIFASSSSIYGDIKKFPTPEESPKQPKSPYALQKYSCELYLKQFNTFYGLPCAFLRFFNVFGPHQIASNAYATVVCAWATAISQNKPIRFDGDGTQSRDFCYVEDVCQAMVLAMQNPNVHTGEAFNIAQGNTTSLNDVFNMFKLEYNIQEANIIRASERAGDVKKTHANIKKAKRLLGYKPKWPFAKGLKTTFEWWASIKNI